MTYAKVIFFVVFFLTAAFVQAQDNLAPEEVRRLTELHQAIRGTYQIQLKASRAQQSIELIMLDQIEANRSETEITFIPYGPNKRILILPRSMIEAKNFKPIKLISYSYIDEP